MRVLAIETSCDETSVAVVEDGYRVLSNITRSQVTHSKFGGVVPEIASREHTRYILPVTLAALEQAQISLNDIDGISATFGPGLIGALLVGLVFGKTLAQVLSKPFLGVNHLEGHLFSVFLHAPEVRTPILFLLVSGGHTELIWMEDLFQYRILGSTLDDACGEAFDKGAKLLGLPYPGGPAIDRLAQKGDPQFHQFPRARVPGLNFSFSGIKTALLYFLRDRSESWVQQHLSDIAASYQEALLDMLLHKLRQAIEAVEARRVAIVGGVSRNTRLRKRLQEEFTDVEILMPPLTYCTDNAAMIGAAALAHFQAGHTSPLTLGADPSASLSSL